MERILGLVTIIGLLAWKVIQGSQKPRTGNRPVAPPPTADQTASTPKKRPSSSKKPAMPAVPPDQAVSPDAITCLLCGKDVQILKSHLTRSHKTNWEAYRKQFDLPEDYPVIAASYSHKPRRGIRAGKGN